MPVYLQLRLVQILIKHFVGRSEKSEGKIFFSKNFQMSMKIDVQLAEIIWKCIPLCKESFLAC